MPDINGLVSIFMIPTTSKSEFIYNNIFCDIKKILGENDISTENIPNKIMMDFEKRLINSVKGYFPDSIINGCFFHYIKILWNKAKSLTLCKKENLKNTKLLIFIFKLNPFLFKDKREKIFTKLDEYFVRLNDPNYK